MSNLSILNTPIRQLDGLFSLNDLHTASGAENKHRPSLFIANQQIKDLIAEIDNSSEAGNPASVKTIKGGRDIAKQGTWACNEIVLAYATWISPKFHLIVLRAFMEMNNIPRTNSDLINAEQQQHIQSLVQQAHHRTGLHWQEIYRLLKVRFKVAKYDQLPAAQFESAVDFLENLQAPQLNRLNILKGDIVIPVDILGAVLMHCKLARSLAEKTENFHRELFKMLGLERYVRNDIAALSHDVRCEYNYFIDEAEKIVERHRRDEQGKRYALAEF